MSDQRRSQRPLSGPPPDTEGIDLGWDDEPLSSMARPPLSTLDEEAFDRPTQIPSVPPEQYVQRAFALDEPAQRGFTPRPTLEPSAAATQRPGAAARAAHTAPDASTLAQRAPSAEHRRRDTLDAITPSSRRDTYGDALGYAEPAAARVLTPAEGVALSDLKDRYAIGDFTGALVLAESLLETDPSHPEARRYAESCREVLMQMYAARLGSLAQIVHVAVSADQIRWLSLDHRSGLLLSLVDGASTLEELLDICGMTRLEALRLMYQLLEQRVIALSPG